LKRKLEAKKRKEGKECFRNAGNRFEKLLKNISYSTKDYGNEMEYNFCLKKVNILDIMHDL